MEIEYRTIVRDGKVVEEESFKNVCCKEMKEALLKQETPLANKEAVSTWLYCPFCKEEIKY